MTEIKRYQEYSYGVEETVIGEFVKYDDHAAIVALLKSDSESNLKSAQYSAETNRKIVRKNGEMLEKITELQEQLRAWENENAAMRSAINQTIGWQESVDPSNTESVRMLVELTTPNTDAALREIRAQAIEIEAMKFHEKAFVAFENSKEIGPFIRADLQQSAARIRAGEQP